MSKLNWGQPYKEADPARVTDVGDYGALADGECVLTDAERRRRAAQRALEDDNLLARSEKIRLEQLAKKKARLQSGNGRRA